MRSVRSTPRRTIPRSERATASCLLFGQSYPLECRTNQSAKYTHTLFITLQGTPKITEEPPELDGTLGSHSATFQISVGQQALRDALAQYLDIASSDSSVLEITGITVTPDAQYSDLATVTVHYTVHAEGEVELSFGFGGTSIAENRQVTTKQPEEKPTEPTKPAETTPSTEPSEGPGGGPSAPTGGAEPRETTPFASMPSEAAPSEPDEPTAAVDPETISMYALPDALAAQLQSGGQAEAPGAADPVPVTVVTVQPGGGPEAPAADGRGSTCTCRARRAVRAALLYQREEIIMTSVFPTKFCAPDAGADGNSGRCVSCAGARLCRVFRWLADLRVFYGVPPHARGPAAPARRAAGAGSRYGLLTEKANSTGGRRLPCSS